MPDENLLKYIKEGLAQGRTEDILRPLLLSAGWAQKDVDDAFVFTKGGSVVQPTAQPVAQTQVQLQAQPQPSPSLRPSLNKKLWIVAGVLVLVLVLFGGWAAYAYFVAPSPQQVLDAMFQTGFSGINAVDNDTMIAINIHVIAASSTATTTGDKSSVTGLAANPYASMLLGGGSGDLAIQVESSGTYLTDPNGNHNADQNMKLSINAGQAGQSITFNTSGEFRVVDGVSYINISTIPNFGFFDPTSFEGKWIKFQADSSTASMAQGLTGVSLPTVSSTTLSAADAEKITGAMEKIIAVTKTLPNETLSGVSNYHYQYAIDKQGLQSADLAIAAVAMHAIGGATSTTLDASTTDAITASTADFLGAFTTMGGDIWIGKSDHYPHQVSLTLAFATTTAYGTISGTINVTSTQGNINGGQTISIPSGAQDFQTLMESAFSSAATATPKNTSAASSSR